MPVALADLGSSAISLGGQRIFLQNASPGAQAHGAAHLFHAQQLAQLIDDAVRTGGVKLARIGVLEAADVAGKLDAGGLHAQANSKVRNLLLAGIADGVQHALDAALAKAAGHQDPIESLQLRLITPVLGSFRLQPLGLDPGNIEFQVVSDGSVGQSFLQRLVTVLILHILAHDGNGNVILGVVAAVHQRIPSGQIGLRRFLVQVLEDERVHAFPGETERALVDGRHVNGPDDGLLFDVTESGDLLFHLARQGAVRAAEQHVGLDANRQQFLDGVLRRLGLQFLSGGDPRHQREVDKNRVFAAQFLAHLADGLKKRQ